MGVINVALPTGKIKHIKDFSEIMNQILKQEIPINILKFSTDSFGTNLLLDVPEDKINLITELLKENRFMYKLRCVCFSMPYRCFNNG